MKERFLSKVKVSENGCHEWTSVIHRDGYGKFHYKGKQAQAHRVAWVLFNGEIPYPLWVLHKCDNRKCVNPEHLYLGDAKQNTKDKIDRGRSNLKMKLPIEEVEDIRRLYAAGKSSQQELADLYGIHQTHVSRYVRRTARQTI